MQKRTRLALIAGLTLVLALEGSAASLSADNFIAATVWRSIDVKLGGLSGLELSDDGHSFTAISDRSGWTKGRITRDTGGRITGLVATAAAPLKDSNAQPLEGHRGDSEGLAIAPNGDAFVSFEGKGAARIMRFADMSAPGHDLPRDMAFHRLRQNAALEALAIDAQGRLYTLPESPRGEGPYPVFRYQSGKWDSRLTLPRDAGFEAVGADFGPDGRFYLLERAFHGIFGFASRVRSFAMTPAGFADERLEMQSRAGRHDNLESISLWRDAAGGIRMTLLSDDNFFWAQRTEIVEYHVVP